MKKLPIILLLFLNACAYNRDQAETKTVTTSTNGTTTTTYQKARSTTYASGDTKSVIGKNRASAGRVTTSVGATGIDESSTTTNFNSALSTVKDIIQSLPK